MVREIDVSEGAECEITFTVTNAPDRTLSFVSMPSTFGKSWSSQT